MMAKVLHHVPVSAIRAFARTCRNASEHAKITVVKRAEEYGYVGSDYGPAQRYLQATFDWFEDLLEQGIEDDYSDSSEEYYGNGHRRPPQYLEALPASCVVRSSNEKINIEETIRVFKAYRDPPARRVAALRGGRSEYLLRLTGVCSEAAAAGEIGHMSLLLKLGVGINGLDKDGNTALYRAVSAGSFKAAAFLIKNGANLETVCRGRSPLQHNVEIELL